MTRKLTDRDMLTRTLLMLEGAPCCDATYSMGVAQKTMCPGPWRRPVHMMSCAQATAAWDLRQYLQRHGGWCPEHGQDLNECHPPDQRPATLGYHPSHGGQLCYCDPVTR